LEKKECTPRPPGFEGLLPHQLENVAFATQRRVTLMADPPGLGKTLSAIATINHFNATKRVLIICPASLKLNWKREWERFTSLKNLSVSVVSAKHAHFSDVTIINYDIVQKYHKDLIAQRWDFMILDEAHYIKNPTARRTQFIFGKKKKRGAIPGIPHNRLLMLTGTPMLNRPVDLWKICEIADPLDLGRDYFAFVKRYCAAWKGPWGLDVSGASNLEELGDKLRSKFMIRHDKGILNLPNKFQSIIELPTDGLGVDKLLKQELELFDKVQLDYKKDFTEQVEQLKHERHAERVKDLTDLAAVRQQIALKKLPMLKAFVNDILDQGEKVIIFTYHRAVAKELIEMYMDRCVVITGDVPTDERQVAVDTFQTDPKKDVFIGQMRAAGVGLTLTAARTVVFAEIDYVPGVLEQAEDRAHRISQDRPVNVYYLVLEGSNDATIMRAVVEKRLNIQKVVENTSS
jgi:SNF2 family DNA or RNA helicase